mmetsp:Transcript_18223/g.18286  ORF Transcript_18223/g.18286 Transcript_18223/m.18286 type:complete len:227 (+) Transcript_18223:94-774(+)|eukprot:CAMPEP_0182419804 /NCGR_PEP_ID=MMETSP1167-20130531/4168_1 /TAXON_ID=2988 /ORGANISM="Mallomonas Sp, Strain CCMP3275" /LENGTH=226 /DNA_ID=CAMNT_0024594905 /DNA_START=94 /DNA_END=774 /DNA_ORIENTATION=+
MYTTKLVNKNIVEGGKYISIGDEYKDPKLNIFREAKKGEKPPVPFVTKKLPENEGKGFFTKHTYTPSEFKEAVLYVKTQPLEKRTNGFGSRDATRRDEFTSAIRTEQYRETVRKERSSLPAPSDEMLEKTQALLRATTAPAASQNFQYRLTATQYDIGRTHVTEFDPKATRDRYYKLATNRDKVIGPYRPSSTDIGGNAWDTEYQPPQYGSKAEIKHFYDKSHLQV